MSQPTRNPRHSTPAHPLIRSQDRSPPHPRPLRPNRLELRRVDHRLRSIRRSSVDPRPCQAAPAPPGPGPDSDPPPAGTRVTVPGHWAGCGGACGCGSVSPSRRPNCGRAGPSGQVPGDHPHRGLRPIPRAAAPNAGVPPCWVCPSIGPRCRTSRIHVRRACSHRLSGACCATEGCSAPHGRQGKTCRPPRWLTCAIHPPGITDMIRQ